MNNNFNLQKEKFVYHNWGCTSIYCPLSYPLRSLKCTYSQNKHAALFLDLHHKNIPEKSVKIFRINLRGAVFKQQTPHTAVDKLQLKKAYSKFNKNIINNTIKTPTILFY